MDSRRVRLASFALLALGLLRMTADVAQVPAVAGLAAATHASPAPKVFSAVRGLETFSTRFIVEWRTADGEQRSVELTREIYARLGGPYNRRNVYGAALAYGPVLSDSELTRPMFESVLRYALGGEAPLLRELGLHDGPAPTDVRVRVEPLPGTDMGELPREFPVR